LFAQGQTVTVDVHFKLTELEAPDRPLPGVPVRLVLGQGPNWQDPNAGNRFVTDDKGEARYSAPGIVDRRWSVTTGLSLPQRSDHIMLAAELEQLIPTSGGQYRHLQWLYTLDIDCYTTSDCASSDISAVYARDAKGRFTVKGVPPDLKMPELGGMILTGPGYKATDFFLRAADAERKRWTVKLTLQRTPSPVWR
jgi:hypothetical protein